MRQRKKTVALVFAVSLRSKTGIDEVAYASSDICGT